MKTHLLLVLLASAAPAFAQSQARPQTGAPGAVKATTSILADGSRETRVVNPEKREATETLTDSSGKVMRKTWFSLNERDFTTGAVHYDAKGNIKYKESFKRDSADRLTASYFYSKNDQLLGHRVFNYDANGKITNVEDYDSKGTLIPAKAPSGGKKGRR